MTPETQRAAHAHALDEYPRECCGYVIIRKGRERYFPCRNAAEKPEDHFVISFADQFAAEAQGEIVAVVHSHPNVPARPSEGDRVGCEASALPWVIISVMPGPVVADTLVMEPSGYEAPLVGRSWHHGVLDCWALCRDWYSSEMGFVLPNPFRADGWWDDGVSDLYSNAAMADAGFEEVPVASLQRGDLVLMQIRSKNLVPNHAAVYIGDGKILHHLVGRLSGPEVYGGYWQEVTRSAWRLANDAKEPT